MPKKYIVDEDDLRRMLDAELRLGCLEADGVDNWSWYMVGRDDYLRAAAGEYGNVFREDEYIDFDDVVEMEMKLYTEVKENETV